MIVGILVNAAQQWRYTGGTSSYFAGMGKNTHWNGSTDKFGNTGRVISGSIIPPMDNEGLFHCMKGLYNGHGLTNTTGNFEFGSW